MPITSGGQAVTIPAETANHVLWHFGRGGYQPGSFTQYLMQAFCSADLVNFHRLAATYPDYGAAISAAQDDENGIAKLQQLAGGAAA